MITRVNSVISYTQNLYTTRCNLTDFSRQFYEQILLNLIKKPCLSSDLPTKFEQSVFDQLKSLVEDIRNASIFMLSCFAEDELGTSISFCVMIFLLFALNCH